MASQGYRARSVRRARFSVGNLLRPVLQRGQLHRALVGVSGYSDKICSSLGVKFGAVGSIAQAGGIGGGGHSTTTGSGGAD